MPKGAFQEAEEAEKAKNLITVKAKCNHCHNVQTIKIDNPEILKDDFGADCKICRDRHLHSVVKPEEKK